jgi:hypothetical protein
MTLSSSWIFLGLLYIAICLVTTNKALREVFGGDSNAIRNVVIIICFLWLSVDLFLKLV